MYFISWYDVIGDVDDYEGHGVVIVSDPTIVTYCQSTNTAATDCLLLHRMFSSLGDTLRSNQNSCVNTLRNQMRPIWMHIIIPLWIHTITLVFLPPPPLCLKYVNEMDIKIVVICAMCIYICCSKNAYHNYLHNSNNHTSNHFCTPQHSNFAHLSFHPLSLSIPLSLSVMLCSPLYSYAYGNSF